MNKLPALFCLVALFLSYPGQTLFAGDAPIVVQDPQSQTLIASEDAQFSVIASGTEPLAYQWRFNDADLTGENGTNYLVNNSQGHHAGNYTVVVTNAHGAVTSAVAVLTVEYPRVLVNPPGAWLSVAEGGVGGTVNFSIAPLPHAPQAYQWRFNGTDIQSATGSNFVLNIQSPANAGEFSVWVKTTNDAVVGPPTRLEVFTVKAAREQWRTNAITPATIVKMLTDESGNLYLAANYHLAGFNVVKLNKDGQLLWNSNFKTPPCNCDQVSDLALDAEGNVYATGYAPLNSGGTEQGYLTVKYSPQGSNCWSAIYYGVFSSFGRTSMARGVAVDGAGNVYVTGGSTGTNTTYPYDIATVKYDRDGNQVWLRRYDGGQHDSGYGIALDSQTNVIATGETTSSGVVIKYDRDGNLLWLSPDGSGRKVQVDTNDNIFVASAAGTITQLNKTNGQATPLGSMSGASPQLIAFVTDGQGRMVAIGNSGGAENQFIVHGIRSGGSNEWNDSFPGYAYSGAVDSRGNVYVTGYKPNSGYLGRTVKWNAEGWRAWVLDPPGISSGLAVSVDKKFNVSVANSSGTVIGYEQNHRLHPLGFQASGAFRLALTGEPRGPVWLKASTNLLNWQNLAPLQFSVGTADFTDAEAAILPFRFYRTESVIPPPP